MCEAEVKLASFEQRIAELKDVGEASYVGGTSVESQGGDGDRRYRALQAPVFRIKTDRAKEFVSKRFREWTTARDLEHCFTAGDEPTGNTRAEIEVGVLKNAARVLLQSAGLPVPGLAYSTQTCSGRTTSWTATGLWVGSTEVNPVRLQGYGPDKNLASPLGCMEAPDDRGNCQYGFIGWGPLGDDGGLAWASNHGSCQAAPHSDAQ